MVEGLSLRWGGHDMSWPYVRVGCILGAARCAVTKGGARDGFLRRRDVSCTSRRDATCRVRGG